MGEEIVRELLRDDGMHVVAASRSERRVRQLAERLHDCDTGRLVPFVVDLTSVANAEADARRATTAYGGFDALVASLGGWWQGGPLLAVDETAWHAVLDEMLTSHFVFARAFLPELVREPGRLYVNLGGGAALAPIRDSALVSVAGAAQIMLTRALARELRDIDVEILELLVDGPVATRDSAAAAGNWITATDVGRVVAELVRSRATSWPRATRNGPLLTMRPLG